MARRRAEDEYDDEDDYLPRRRREPEGGGFPVALWGGLGIGAIVVVGLLVVFMTRSRETHQTRAEAETARAEADQARAEAERAAERAAAGARGLVPRPGEPAWPRMIGTWERVPRGRDDNDYPFRFEFRDDFTATSTRMNFGGNPVGQDSRVEILGDQNDTVRLRLLVPRGVYGYTFTLQPDGTLELEDGRGGLVFTRVD